MNEVNESITKTFGNELIKGFDNSMKTLGSNWYKLNENLITQEEAAKNMSDVWKDVGLAMLEALGPAMTQAGFALITRGALDGSKAMIGAGIGLVAAGGVAEIAAGLLGEGNKDDDKNKEEEDRLERLRDLLCREQRTCLQQSQTR